MYKTHLAGSLSFIFFLLLKTILRFFCFILLYHAYISTSYSLTDNEFIYICVKFDFYFHLESQEQSNEQMIMKCTNLIQQDNKNSDDDNQDSEKKSNKKN